MREINKEMAIARIGNDIGITWSFFQTQPGVSWKVPFDLTILDLSLTLFSPLTGDVAIHDFSVTDNSLHWVFKGKDQSKLGKYTLTLTVNKGQDNQHVVDRIEFLELVSRSNSGVIRRGRVPGDRSVLETEGIVLGTVIDYGYETVAHAMMTYARKEDMEAMMRNAYLAISRKGDGLFKVDYDALDEEYARDYFEHRAPMPFAGGCSVIAHGGLVGRNMDWLKRHPDGKVDAVFEVHTSAAQGRYASFGFAGSLAELSVEKVESREYSDAYRLLPYYLQDGENEKGLMAAILVVPATSSRVSVPEVEKRDRVCSLALVRYILDHYQSVDEAVTGLRNYVEIFHPASLTTMGYEPHFFLKDSTKSVVLEFSGTGLVAIENNVCTNFHQHGVTFNPDGTVWTNADVLDGHMPSSQGIENYGSGLERFNAMVTADPESKEEMRELLDSILFSKAYTLAEGVWNSEFVGGNITVDTPADAPALLARLAEYRQKYADDADDVWITKQSVIYDLANFSASLTVFEGEEEYKAAIDHDENVATKDFVEQRVANFITRSVNDLVNYYLKSETYTKTEVQEIIAAVKQFVYVSADSLPEASSSTMHKIYLIPSSEPKTGNVRDEFITIDNGADAETRYTWEQIGSTAIDLSGYYTSQQTDAAISAALTAALANYTTTAALTLLLAGKQDTLTPVQLAAVNSGITATKLTTLESNVGNLQTTVAGHTTAIASLQSEIDSFIGAQTNFVGIVASTSALPTVTEPSWGLVGSDIDALNAYVYNGTSWAQFGTKTYDFTDFSGIKNDVVHFKMHCIGNGSTLVSVADMQKVPVVAGRKYRFTPLVWDFDGTGTSARVFQIYFFDSTNTYIAEPSVAVGRETLPLADFYELTAPDNAVSVGVGGRAKSGTDNVVLIEDITYFASEKNPVTIQEVAFKDTIASENRLNPVTCVLGYVDKTSGVVKTSISTRYATDFIPVSQNGLYVSGKSSYGSNGGHAVYDANKVFIRAIDSPYTYQQGDAYVRFTMSTDAINNLTGYVIEGTQSGHYTPFADTKYLIKKENLPAMDTSHIEDGAITTSKLAAGVAFPSVMPAISLCGKDCSIATTESIDAESTLIITDFPKYLKAEGVVSLSAKITTFDNVSIGFGSASGSNAAHIKVDATNIYQMKGGASVHSYAHGLNIASFLNVTFDNDLQHPRVIIATLDGIFVKELTELTYHEVYGSPILITGANTSLADVELRCTSDKFRKPIWVIGDSYASLYSQRWTEQMIETFGIDNFLLIGLAGGDSSDMYPDLEKALNHGTPKFLIWCIGMNDSYANWSTYFESLKTLCMSKGIELILQTIPIPESGATAKEDINAAIKASGYRYIDACDAMCPNNAYPWYEGYCDDGVHPTTLGAKVLASRFLADFPEFLQ